MTTLTLQQANAIIAGALAQSAKSGYLPMGVVVIDDSGNVKAAQREDGASMFRLDVATGKAWGAAWSTPGPSWNETGRQQQDWASPARTVARSARAAAAGCCWPRC